MLRLSCLRLVWNMIVGMKYDSWNAFRSVAVRLREYIEEYRTVFLPRPPPLNAGSVVIRCRVE